MDFEHFFKLHPDAFINIQWGEPIVLSGAPKSRVPNITVEVRLHDGEGFINKAFINNRTILWNTYEEAVNAALRHIHTQIHWDTVINS